MFKSTVLGQTRSKHRNETTKRTDCMFYQLISQLHSSFLVATLLPWATATEDTYPSESGLYLLHGLPCPANLTSPLSSAISPIFLGQDKTGMIDRQMQQIDRSRFNEGYIYISHHQLYRVAYRKAVAHVGCQLQQELLQSATFQLYMTYQYYHFCLIK